MGEEQPSSISEAIAAKIAEEEREANELSRLRAIQEERADVLRVEAVDLSKLLISKDVYPNRTVTIYGDKVAPLSLRKIIVGRVGFWSLVEGDATRTETASGDSYSDSHTYQVFSHREGAGLSADGQLFRYRYAHSTMDEYTRIRTNSVPQADIENFPMKTEELIPFTWILHEYNYPNVGVSGGWGWNIHDKLVDLGMKHLRDDSKKPPASV